MQTPLLAVRPDAAMPLRLAGPAAATVIGAGIAGCTAATVLAERGFRVTVHERRGRLGGRAGGDRHALRDGTDMPVDHGFHAYFRQYYNLRAVLRRVGARLAPVDRYPITSPRWPDEDFADLPKGPPWSLLALLRRSPSMRWRDLIRMDGAAATPLLSYDAGETPERLDNMTAADFFDRLRLPPRARSMLFDVFAHSFFNREEQMSAAELVAMFHFYFLGNPEGLAFDAADGAHQDAVFAPWARYLEGLGVEIELGSTVDRLADVEARPVVVAVDVGALRDLAVGSELEPQVAGLVTAPPYAVLRLWTARGVGAERAVFAGVADAATLDSITLVHRLEAESRQWAVSRGGAVIELHGYAVDPEGVRDRLVDDLALVYPETVGLPIVDEHLVVASDCPGFPPGTARDRAGVDVGCPGVFLAGDHVSTPFPSALMERAAMSGVLAANRILAAHGLQAEPVWSVPQKGLLARRPMNAAARPRRRRGRGTGGR